MAHPQAGEVLAIPIGEAARRLSVSRTTAYMLARTGELPTVRIGARMRVPIAALEHLLKPVA